MPTVTQLISPWTNGEQTTYQFYSHTAELWIIQKDNTGATLSRSEHKLGEQFSDVVKVFSEHFINNGWEKYQQGVA